MIERIEAFVKQMVAWRAEQAARDGYAHADWLRAAELIREFRKLNLPFHRRFELVPAIHRIDVVNNNEAGGNTDRIEHFEDVFVVKLFLDWLDGVRYQEVIEHIEAGLDARRCNPPLPRIAINCELPTVEAEALPSGRPIPPLPSPGSAPRLPVPPPPPLPVPPLPQSGTLPPLPRLPQNMIDLYQAIGLLGRPHALTLNMVRDVRGASSALVAELAKPSTQPPWSDQLRDAGYVRSNEYGPVDGRGKRRVIFVLKELSNKERIAAIAGLKKGPPTPAPAMDYLQFVFGATSCYLQSGQVMQACQQFGLSDIVALKDHPELIPAVAARLGFGLLSK